MQIKVDLKSRGMSSESRLNPYEKPIKSTRKGDIFQVHPYPTKIHYRSIIPFILAHTKPGETVYDCFAGTCSTALAAASCVEPDLEVLSWFSHESRSDVSWGPRRTICVDIGVLPSFIGRILLTKADASEFSREANRVIDALQSEWGWIYRAIDPEGNRGRIRHVIWSLVIACPGCGTEYRFLDLFVDFTAGKFLDQARCLNCGRSLNSKRLEPVMEDRYDRVLGQVRRKIKRVPVRVYGETEDRLWQRDVIPDDLSLLAEIEEVKLPSSIKPIRMLTGEDRWGDMYRAGYHRDILYVHDFYTPRNLLAIAVLYDVANHLSDEHRDHYKLLVSSYNAAHSTLMTRFVFKSAKKGPVITSAQPGALYVPRCPVEKNVFSGVRRKLPTLVSAARKVYRWNAKATVLTRPAQHCGLPSESVDYVFTDPPFAGNIQYSETNFLSEAWLGAITDASWETVVSEAQGKSVEEYERLLTEAFQENFRVLKPGRYMTVIFHNTSKAAWNALRNSIVNSGFEIVRTSILDKEQASFKQTTTSGAVKKDSVILARKPKGVPTFEVGASFGSARHFLERRLAGLGDETIERTFDYLFSRYVGACIMVGAIIDLNASEFRALLEQIGEERDGRWYLKGADE